MRVTLFLRKSYHSNYSIERLFSEIFSVFSDKIDVRLKVCRFTSQGIIKLISNLIEAAFYQGDVNHITGDVHYLAIFLCKNKTLITIHDLVSLYRLSGLRKKLFSFFGIGYLSDVLRW